MARVPIFIWLTIILAVELLLQLYPLTGLFLMLLGAPAWSAFLANGILISLAFDAWRGRLPIWVIGVPAILYGAYLGVYLTARAEYTKLDQQVRASNAGKSMAFNPETQDLLVDYSSRPSPGTPSFATLIVSNYKLQAVYEFNHRSNGRSRVTRLVSRPQCDGFKNDFRRVTTSGLFTRGVFVRNVCGAEFDEPTSKPRITLRPWPDEATGGPWPVVLQPVDITNPDGQSIRLTTGTIQLPAIIPMPIIGCTLISSIASWKCFAYFGPALKPIGGDHAPGSDGRPRIAAAALGLQPRTVVNVRRERLGLVLSSPMGELDSSEVP